MSHLMKQTERRRGLHILAVIKIMMMIVDRWIDRTMSQIFI